MNASTIALHRSLVRLAKGMLKAYETWLSDQTAEVMTAQLKRERVAFTETDDDTAVDARRTNR